MDWFTFVSDLATTRGAQLLARYLSKFFVGYGVYQATAADNNSLAVASAVIATVLAVADHLIHKKNAAKAATPAAK